jgi:hypothetical protein
MRVLGLGVSVLAAIFGFVAACGDTDSGEPNGAAGSAGQSVSGAASSAGAGKGGSASAGGSSAGSASAGSPNAGGSSGNGGEPGAAGASSGGSGSLYDCNPTKVACKRLPPECPAFEVPSVDGTCWGDCVEISQCACSEASDCPNDNEYTCWSKRHCGPYVR